MRSHRVPAMRRVGLSILVIVVLVGAALTGPAATAKGGGGTSQHVVDVTWKPDKQDIVPNGDQVVDDFYSYGKPFGQKVRLTTTVSRDQVGTDRRAGEWVLFLRGSKPGRCFGTFDLKRDVIETTGTSQLVHYEGVAKIDKCQKSTKFGAVRAGKLGDVDGDSLCTASGCEGGLNITGRIRY